MKCQRDLFNEKKNKTMNTKMAAHSQLSTTEFKKQTKQTIRPRNRIKDMEITWRDNSREGEAGKWEKR